ncbi:MAG: hypothetical protein WDZ35_02090 [Crocinitomicaceae bacterium]
MKTSTHCFFIVGLLVCSCVRNPQADDLLNESTEVSRNTISKDTVQIIITPEDQILWNKVEIDSAHLSDSLRIMMIRSIESGKRTAEYNGLSTQNKSNYIIYLNVYRQTKYDMYVYVKEKYESELKYVRKLYAKKIFDIPINQLDDRQFTIIRSIVEDALYENPSKGF